MSTISDDDGALLVVAGGVLVAAVPVVAVVAAGVVDVKSGRAGVEGSGADAGVLAAM